MQNHPLKNKKTILSRAAVILIIIIAFSTLVLTISVYAQTSHLSLENQKESKLIQNLKTRNLRPKNKEANVDKPLPKDYVPGESSEDLIQKLKKGSASKTDNIVFDQQLYLMDVFQNESKNITINVTGENIQNIYLTGAPDFVTLQYTLGEDYTTLTISPPLGSQPWIYDFLVWAEDTSGTTTYTRVKISVKESTIFPIFEHYSYAIDAEKTTSQELVINVADDDLEGIYVEGEVPDFVSYNYVAGENSLTLSISPTSNDESGLHLFQIRAEDALSHTFSVEVYIFVHEYNDLAEKISPHGVNTNHAGFGSSTAISGNYAAVGGRGGYNTNYNRVSIFKREGESWLFTQELRPESGAQEFFGKTIAMNNEWLFVGSNEYNPDHNPIHRKQGTVYVYRNTGSGFELTQQLIASNANGFHFFGRSIDISGSTAIVGSQWHPNRLKASGSVYIYELEGINWVEKDILNSPQQRFKDRFAESAISIDGNFIIVGAYQDDQIDSAAGAAYIFEKSENAWQEVVKLFANDGDALDRFGSSVAISGNYALVGSPSDEGPLPQEINFGSMYIFKRDISGTWILQGEKIQASDANACGYFGTSITMDENTAIVGAPGGRDHLSQQTGNSYIMKLVDGNWQETSILFPEDGVAGDWFGYSVGLSPSHIIVGANRSTYYPMNTIRTGSAYISQYDTINIDQQISLKSGWNVISFNVLPENMDMESIVEPLITQGILEILQDDHANNLWPAYNINTIGQMSINEGYKVKMTANAMLTIPGSSIDLPTTLTLNEGWNTIGYPSSQEQDALSILQPLTVIGSEILMQAVDENDNTISFIDGAWVNQIGNFKPGEGYHVKVNSNCTLPVPK